MSHLNNILIKSHKIWTEINAVNHNSFQLNLYSILIHLKITRINVALKIHILSQKSNTCHALRIVKYFQLEFVKEQRRLLRYQIIKSRTKPQASALNHMGFEISMLFGKNRSGFELSFLKHCRVFMYSYCWNEVLKSNAWYD